MERGPEEKRHPAQTQAHINLTENFFAFAFFLQYPFVIVDGYFPPPSFFQTLVLSYVDQVEIFLSRKSGQNCHDPLQM